MSGACKGTGIGKRLDINRHPARWFVSLVCLKERCSYGITLVLIRFRWRRPRWILRLFFFAPFFFSLIRVPFLHIIIPSCSCIYFFERFHICSIVPSLYQSSLSFFSSPRYYYVVHGFFFLCLKYTLLCSLNGLWNQDFIKKKQKKKNKASRTSFGLSLDITGARQWGFC